MTDSSSLSLPFDSDQAAARVVLAACQRDPAAYTLEHPASARGFSGARVLRLCSDPEVLCLRRWPPQGLPEKRIVALHRFLAHLQQSGIHQIAVPLRTASGSTLVQHDGDLWQAEPWMPGDANFHHAPTDQKLRSAMHSLARVHRAAERYDAPSDESIWFARHVAAPSPACHERLAMIRDWTTERCAFDRSRLTAQAPTDFATLADDLLQLYTSARRPIERKLQSLQDTPVPLHPCLRDVWHDHVLFEQDNVTGLIDPAATRTENVATDLSRLLGSLLGDDRPRWKFALAAYHDVRPLAPAEHQLITALDQSSVLLSGLTWIDRFLNDRIAADDLHRVSRRVETIRDRLANLATRL